MESLASLPSRPPVDDGRVLINFSPPSGHLFARPAPELTRPAGPESIERQKGSKIGSPLAELRARPNQGARPAEVDR